MCEIFDKSVWDIVGLTEYYPRTLPDWLRERLRECCWGGASDSATDDVLVKSHVDQGYGWLLDWGTAIVAGKPVFICESDALTDPICLAADLGCGLVFVEPSDGLFEIGFTVYFTEGFRTTRSSDQLLDEVACSLAE